MERRLLDALFLTHRNLANFLFVVRTEATVDVHGYVSMHTALVVSMPQKHTI